MTGEYKEIEAVARATGAKSDILAVDLPRTDRRIGLQDLNTCLFVFKTLAFLRLLQAFFLLKVAQLHALLRKNGTLKK